MSLGLIAMHKKSKMSQEGEGGKDGIPWPSMQKAKTLWELQNEVSWKPMPAQSTKNISSVNLDYPSLIQINRVLIW